MLYRFSILLIGSLFFLSPVFGQFVEDAAASALSYNTVTALRFEGLQTLDEISVRNRVSVPLNQPLAPAVLASKVRASVSSLYESGLFDDVTAYYDFSEKRPGELELVFAVRELPALDTVVLEGVDALNKEDLSKLITLQSGKPYSRSQVERDRQALMAHYRSNGYLLAEVGIREEEGREGGNQLVFVIREGEKVVVHSIEVHGNERVPKDDIIESMATKVHAWYGSGEFKEDVFEGDRDSVLLACKTHGFLDAELTDYRAEYLPDSSFRFYMGRVVPQGRSVLALRDQLNADVESGALAELVGRAEARNTHYYRRYRRGFSDAGQALPVRLFENEEQVVAFLNRVVLDPSLRRRWLDIHKERVWSDVRIDSLMAKKKRSAFEDRMLVRLSLEEVYPVLQKWDSITTGTQVTIHIGVREGRRYYAGGVYFTNNEVIQTPVLKSLVLLDSGKVFNYRQYEMTKKTVMDAYREEGYLFARFDEKRAFEDSLVHLTFDLTEGLPAQIRKVFIRGNTRTKDKVIRREIKLFPGDTYRQSLMERSFRDVYQLNYFDNLVPDIRPVEGSEQDVDLIFDVKEREAGTGTFSAGMAYSAADGLVGTLGLSIPNCCMGDGQKADLNVEYGGQKKNFSVGFTEPWLMDRPITLGGSLNYTWYKGTLADKDIIRYGGRVFTGKRLEWPDDYFYAQTSYALQRNKQGDNVANSLIVNSGWESSVGLTVIRDDKNLPIFPTEGSRLVTSVSWSGLGGDFRFVKTDLSFKWWFPLLRLNRETLALGITNEYGFIVGDALQYSALYQMGGALGYQGLMRGYSAGSIGYRRLGRSYQFFSAELTYPIAQNRFYILPFFFDAGNVFGKRYDPTQLVSKDQPSPFSEWDPSSLKRDVGFGFRVIVPMLGIIGFDFAWPLDKGETYSGYEASSVGGMEFNFLIGQGF